MLNLIAEWYVLITVLIIFDWCCPSLLNHGYNRSWRSCPKKSREFLELVIFNSYLPEGKSNKNPGSFDEGSSNHGTRRLPGDDVKSSSWAIQIDEYYIMYTYIYIFVYFFATRFSAKNIISRFTWRAEKKLIYDQLSQAELDECLDTIKRRAPALEGAAMWPSKTQSWSSW